MDRGFSDEAIVGVKSIADEDAVTYQNYRKVAAMPEPKGGTCYQNRTLGIDVVMSSAVGTVF